MLNPGVQRKKISSVKVFIALFCEHANWSVFPCKKREKLMKIKGHLGPYSLYSLCLHTGQFCGEFFILCFVKYRITPTPSFCWWTKNTHKKKKNIFLVIIILCTYHLKQLLDVGDKTMGVGHIQINANLALAFLKIINFNLLA